MDHFNTARHLKKSLLEFFWKAFFCVMYARIGVFLGLVRAPNASFIRFWWGMTARVGRRKQPIRALINPKQ